MTSAAGRFHSGGSVKDIRESLHAGLMSPLWPGSTSLKIRPLGRSDAAGKPSRWLTAGACKPDVWGWPGSSLAGMGGLVGPRQRGLQQWWTLLTAHMTSTARAPHLPLLDPRSSRRSHKDLTVVLLSHFVRTRRAKHGYPEVRILTLGLFDKGPFDEGPQR